MDGKISLSIIIPACNDAKALKQNIPALIKFMDSIEDLTNYELLIIDNGSIDNTKDFSVSLSKSILNIRYLQISERSFGKAIKLGLSEAHCDYVGFMSADIGFGYEHIKQAILEIKRGNDMVLGSKLHSKSTYKAPASRKIFSRFCNFLFRLLFSSNVRDTQGTFFVRRDCVLTYINSLTSTGPWIQAQLVLGAQKRKLKISEIPVTYVSGERKSTFKIVDALKFISEMINEYSN